jgi:ribosomal protein S18 acetylase RimI-like enzyme
MSIRKKLFIAIVSLSLVIAGVTSYRYASGAIDAYNATSDRAFILDIFQKNWYWLVSEYSTDFSPEFMLDTRSSSRNIHDRGNLTIKVYHKQGVPVGFVAYYVKTAYQGFILFLAVDEQYRSRGYARRLMGYALQDLKKRGCIKARLVTRVSNTKGQKVYTGLGFKEVERYNGFITYEKTLA